MPFVTFKSAREAMRTFQIADHEVEFVGDIRTSISDYFRSELEISLLDFDVDCSEWAVCENLIYPILKGRTKAAHRNHGGLESSAAIQR